MIEKSWNKARGMLRFRRPVLNRRYPLYKARKVIAKVAAASIANMTLETVVLSSLPSIGGS